ncbi:MAG: glutathione S-transferase family protein [Candidatus Eremiobacteraeota bacterium]|nr:glutathione S-transferase family protein [Candidatus Eremiobacteraeota bacterium]MCW5866786.1 glutathione S-transferase family protein [Candidatus Eremiobacteraeota bacterium]
MLKLYTAQVCPFAHRCRLALRLGHLEHERVEIDLADMPDWYRHISPNQKVPLLEHNGHRIWESAIINEYLADVFSDRGLLPHDPLLRAKFRLAVDWAGNAVIPTFYQVLRNEQADAAERLHQAIADMPQWMSLEGPFWLGEQPSLADAAIYPWFERWIALEHYRDFRAEWPTRVESWLETMRAHPLVQAEAGDPQRYVSAYARYATPAKV